MIIMLLLTISLVLIIIAVYAIYRHFKSRSVNTLDAGRRNKNASFATLPFVHSVQVILLSPSGNQRAAPDNCFIAAAAPTADGLRQIGYNYRLFCGGRPSRPPPLNPQGLASAPRSSLR
ncbi:hypothetical protein FG183_14130 [Serratia marcescens subsp. marcescens ATCC 13880]|nr:hypothetical protein FG183_14130 [Serratia marcescens subsp. marcescens ATCC 13880]